MDRSAEFRRMHVTMRQLEVFEAVARVGSIARAAEALHLSPPAISMQLKQLAESVDQPLYELTGKRLVVTPVGEALLQTARAMFETWRGFERTAADLRALRSGCVRIACTASAAGFLPRFVDAFRAKHPGIDVQVEVAPRDVVVERLAGNADDLCVLDAPPAQFDIACHRFLANPLVPIAAVDHPLAARKRIPLARFLEAPMLARERGSGTRLAFERFLRDQGVTPSAWTELDSNAALIAAVAAGRGVGVISRLALPENPADAGVRVLPVQALPVEAAWHAMHPGGKKLSPAAMAFLDHLSSPAAPVIPPADCSGATSRR
jgi:LysR family transcriptional regulator, low CO2-responsive transcriptional regulator